jgi:hypothetical protein
MMRTTARPAKAPTIKIGHARIQSDPDYRHEVREKLAIGVDVATEKQSPALVPVIVPVHEPSGSCCQLERWELSLARLTGAWPDLGTNARDASTDVTGVNSVTKRRAG